MVDLSGTERRTSPHRTSVKLEALRVRNYRCFRNVDIPDIPQFCVLVGANGAGKTTFFDVFGFLRDALTNNVRQALQVRGGFGEVISRGAEQETIQIDLKFRMPLVGKERLVAYRLEIGLDEQKQPCVRREVLRYKRSTYGSPYHFLDFQNGQGFAISNEEDFDKPDEKLNRELQSLDDPHILAIKGLGQFQRFKAASSLRSLIESWHLSDFHIGAAHGATAHGYAEHLSVQGDNLPLVAQFLYERYPPLFDAILKKMERRVPGVVNVQAKPTEDGRLVLRFQDGSFKDPFVSRWVSDGTIKMFAYLVLLHDPAPHPLLCVEEPENQLYPSLLRELAEEFQEYAQRGGQAFVSTHSPDFLNAVPLESIYWLEKVAGYTRFVKASGDETLRNLIREGDRPGYLWSQGLFGRVDPR
ncbi:MAG: AAA family ATPase [Magnetospirillum sp. WYHS-4]